MPTITIKNVGPIKEAAFDLNKINVFMGPQSSGKSTIAKIISHCTWVEKDVATQQSLEEYQNDDKYFIRQLEDYHKIKGYIKPESFISYQSETIKITYTANRFDIAWADQHTYKRSKISYIPSERNMVILPEMETVQFENNSIRSFLFDWFDARRNHTEEKRLSLPSLDIAYYYSESSKENRIKGKDNGSEYDILLSNASSGLQSIIPLAVMIDYLTEWVYKSKRLSYLEKEKSESLSHSLILSLIKKTGNDGDILTELIHKYRGYLLNIHNSQFIIEEPEQNLFPEAQRDLIYYLLEKCLDKEKDHRMTITTHSPYILYALNNCMLGKMVADKLSDEEWDGVKCRSALIDSSQVSIYQIENGELKSIQQEDGLIGDNYFDKKMKEIMDDFYTFLNHYDDDK